MNSLVVMRRNLFSLISRMIDNPASSALSSFFVEKIRVDLSTRVTDSVSLTSADVDTAVSPFSLSQFCLVSEGEVGRKSHFEVYGCFLSGRSSPHYRIILEHLDVLLAIITTIINISLSSGTVPRFFKSAVVKPLLKQPNLDPNVPENNRPVSNLPFLSKLREHVAEQRYFTTRSLRTLFRDVPLYCLFGYLRETNIFARL